MSLLDRSHNAIVTVFHQVEYIDEDGNVQLEPSEVGIPDVPAILQPMRQSGTSARRAEQANEGWETEELYRLRFPRWWEQENGPLGIAAEIEWNGERWKVFGKPVYYNGSRRTRHVDYTVIRN